MKNNRRDKQSKSKNIQELIIVLVESSFEYPITIKLFTYFPQIN